MASELASPAQDLGAMARAVARRWRPALAVLAITLLGAVVASRLGDVHYEATAQILLQQPDQVNAVLNPDATASAANAQREVNTNAELITSIPVIEAVRRQLRLRESAQSLIARLSVDGEATSNLVRITARDSRPEAAARIATAVAVHYQAYRRRSAQDAIGLAVSAARDRVLAMSAPDRDSAEGQALAARLHQLETGAAVTTGGVQVVRPADVPASPAPRLTSLEAAVALLLGLLLAACVVAVLERIDRRLVGYDDIEAAFGRPVLARVPRRGRRRRGHDPERVAAYDALAARLRFTPPGDAARVLMVTAVMGRSRDRVADELAAAIADLGEDVLMMIADLRDDGSQGAQLVSRPPRGLTAVLRRESTLAAELVTGSCAGEDGRPVDDAPCWQLLRAGGRVRRSASLLAEAASGVMREARERADVVIVVAPPLTATADVLVLGPLCDAIIVAVGEEPITRDDARRAKEILAALPAPVLGIVVDRGGRPPAQRPWLRGRVPQAHAARVGAVTEPGRPTTARA